MIKAFIFFAIFILANALTHVEAAPNDNDRISFKYIAAGTGVSLGFRAHQNHGYDISLNHNFILDQEYSGKIYYLNYPFYNRKILAYWGIGAGLTYWENAPFRNAKYTRHHPNGISAITQRTWITNEMVFGYEFLKEKNTRIFCQLEVGNGLLVLLPELFPTVKIGISF